MLFSIIFCSLLLLFISLFIGNSKKNTIGIQAIFYCSLPHTTCLYFLMFANKQKPTKTNQNTHTTRKSFEHSVILVRLCVSIVHTMSKCFQFCRKAQFILFRLFAAFVIAVIVLDRHAKHLAVYENVRKNMPNEWSKKNSKINDRRKKIVECTTITVNI